MHKITPLAKHLVVHATVAISADVLDSDDATDGLNEMFNTAIENDFIADYSFSGINHVTAGSNPEEGCLFVKKPINEELIVDLEYSKPVVVYVVGVESLTSGGFDWYPDYCSAEKNFNCTKKTLPMHQCTSQVSLFSYVTEKEFSKDEITQEIDTFFNEFSRTAKFNNSANKESFPFTNEAWNMLITEHDSQ
ncbi:hypothetical protein [Photobacterium kishitanii]|uniref:Uncharacterized protein n=1 Tax=Photobacterium kishitanii TaxID=318456 RepID=A0A2T3KB12_9GAMM|nr:hypothetical protein [Photobacterium kishitanii]PSU89789.1 hypothetical protein C9J27_24210 [Photobacterium kishitanii]